MVCNMCRFPLGAPQSQYMHPIIIRQSFMKYETERPQGPTRMDRSWRAFTGMNTQNHKMPVFQTIKLYINYTIECLWRLWKCDFFYILLCTVDRLKRKYKTGSLQVFVWYGNTWTSNEIEKFLEKQKENIFDSWWSNTENYTISKNVQK